MPVVNGQQHSIESAKFVLAGYAFATRPVSFDSGSRAAVGDVPVLPDQAVWGYRSYDCVPADPDGPLEERDLLVAAGLNGRLDSKGYLSLRTISSPVSAVLARIDDTPFWDLSENDVTIPPSDEASPAWPLWRAWWLMIGMPNVGPALTHKVLHHKRPSYFPLLDRKTLAALPRGRKWSLIHEELNRDREQYDELELWFAELARVHDGVPIKRLRMHDILLWCRVGETDDEASDRWAAVLRDGEAVLRR